MIASIMFGPFVSDLFCSAVFEHLKQITDKYDDTDDANKTKNDISQEFAKLA